jgi:hypothetical protein
LSQPTLRKNEALSELDTEQARRSARDLVQFNVDDDVGTTG